MMYLLHRHGPYHSPPPPSPPLRTPLPTVGFSLHELVDSGLSATQLRSAGFGSCLLQPVPLLAQKMSKLSSSDPRLLPPLLKGTTGLTLDQDLAASKDKSRTHRANQSPSPGPSSSPGGPKAAALPVQGPHSGGGGLLVIPEGAGE